MDTPNFQTLFNVALGAISFLLGLIVQGLRESMARLQKADAELATKVQSIDVVQPFVARLFGLAALQIDVGSGAGKKIEFLHRTRAYQLRDYLLARAGGEG